MSIPTRWALGFLRVALVTVVTLGLGTPVVPYGAIAQQAPAPEPGTLFLQADRFELDDGSYATAQRGMLLVPQDRSESESGMFGLVFHRFPAADSVDVERPPIFRLHGGPGFGGLELDEPGYYEENVEPYTAFTDVVVVGQRGFSPSVPNTDCEGVKAPIWDPVVPVGERADALRRASRKCSSFWKERGLSLGGMNVREAATDVADVADALGYEQIVLYGVSFGSHWAMAILRDHPDLVTRALIGGTEGPNHTYDSPTGLLNALRRVSEDAESAPELQPWIPEDGLIEALRATIRRVEKNPASVSVYDSAAMEEKDATITATILRSVAKGYSAVPDSLHDMAAWPADVLRLYAGNVEDIVRRGLAGGKDDWTRIPNAAFWLLDCASGITEARATELFNDPAQRIVGPAAWTYREGCPAWEIDLGDDFRTGFKTDLPTLVVHGNWDLATPYENALAIMPSFTNGKLVTVERGTHGALEEAVEASDTFRESVLRFLRTGDMDEMPERVELPPVDWKVPAELPVAEEGSSLNRESNGSSR